MDANKINRAGASHFGVGLTMFLIFAGLSAAQFHTYLFESKGIKGFHIGLIIMTGQCAAIFSPLTQILAIRRLGGPRIPLMVMLGGAALSLAILPYMRDFPSFLILFAVFSFCAASIFPLNAASTFETMRELGYGAFFKIRSLGTLGFLVGCLISLFFPTLADLPLLYKGFALALLFALGVVIWEYRRNPMATVKSFSEKVTEGLPAPRFLQALKLLGQRETLRLLVVLGLMNFANALATGVQGNYLLHRWNQGQGSISLAWVISTACEVPLMLICARFLNVHGLRHIMALGVFGTVLKLVGLAAAGSLWQFYLALTMHGCFFSGALTGFSIYLDRKYRPEERPTLQTISGVFYSGIPSALAGLTAGWIWHTYSLRAVYLISGAIAISTAVYGYFLLRQPRQSGKEYVF